MCHDAGVRTVFAPAREAMYRPGFQTHVEVERLTSRLEGASRPGHFRGVTTVVAKLLNLTGPCTAIFGRKDYQQWKTIERMVSDLDIPAQIVGAPIVREPDGLALSSRNRYLSPEERARALGIVGTLREVAGAFARGERDPQVLAALAAARLAPHVDRVDYAALADPDELTPLEAAPIPERALLAIAAHVGRTRLIDNLVLGADPTP
jgi:pantoate--beta-alanine ligase